MPPYFLIVSSWFLFGLACSKIAVKKNRNKFNWFILGFFFGLLALIIIFFLKPLQIQTIKENVIIQNEFKHLATLKNDNNYWYYLDLHHKQIGPMSLKKLFDNYLEGKISGNTFVWNDTMTDWIKLKEASVFSDFQKNFAQ